MLTLKRLTLNADGAHARAQPSGACAMAHAWWIAAQGALRACVRSYRTAARVHAFRACVRVRLQTHVRAYGCARACTAASTRSIARGPSAWLAHV
eukprot:2710508-Pleurochrysis_carterae.AAC.1